jgi:hypothetical protein
MRLPMDDIQQLMNLCIKIVGSDHIGEMGEAARNDVHDSLLALATQSTPIPKETYENLVGNMLLYYLTGLLKGYNLGIKMAADREL